MAQHMRAGQLRVQSGAGVREANCAADHSRANTLPKRRAVVNKNVSCDSLRPTFTKIVSKSTADPRRHRQAASAATLPRGQRESGRTPVDVIQPDPADLVGSQAEIEKANSYCIITFTLRLPSIERLQERIYFVVCQYARDVR